MITSDSKNLVFSFGYNKSIFPPYKILIENPASVQKHCVLFGFSKYGMVKNYGSTDGLNVKLSKGMSYADLLRLTANAPMEIRVTRIQVGSGKQNEKQLSQNLTITTQNALGGSVQEQIVVASHMSAMAMVNTVVDVPTPFWIDANTDVSFPVLPNTKFSLTFYPKGSGMGVAQNGIVYIDEQDAMRCVLNTDDYSDGALKDTISLSAKRNIQLNSDGTLKM